MNKVSLGTFSYFDTGQRASEELEPERLHGVKATTMSFEELNSRVCFYHSFVLGLMVELSDKYILTVNKESGFGRCDVMLEPRSSDLDAVILEFKVFNPRRESSLEETVEAALAQIEQRPINFLHTITLHLLSKDIHSVKYIL